ncbi:acyltransferase [Altererythrobacter arenosus]|uniref:Acyltransferase n=1 Tax=Altererythrobacter arenosus TaxID=3032592 RepID=A0ABY8FXF1_9SPHN|nr:acyltransferase [Altererythrobacter sp. CAU 1644]WFL78076.1 acyltransferase [Altererythrobacter sp. CAU 1644]
MESLQGRTLSSLAGEKNGFDTIRLLAACAVIFSHSFPLTGRHEPLMALTGQATLGDLAVAAFFLISGLLVSASFDRGSLARYADRRLRRIMPGLVVSVAISAFVFGSIFSSLPLGEFLVHPETLRFLGNALFLPVGYDLPGVFLDHPMRAVNGSLWSLKYEMACYVFVPIALAAARWRKPAVIAAWLASFAVAWAIPDGARGAAYVLDLGAGLFRFYGTGMLLYLFADRVVIRRDWAWYALALMIAAAFTPLFEEVAATAGAYAMVSFAYLCGKRFRKLTAKGDISYGVYVYAFPIQQMFVPLSLTFALPWLGNALLALPLAAFAGLLSWLVVERPALKYGRKPSPR